MKQRKKIALHLLSALLLCLVLGLALASCREKAPEETVTADTPAETASDTVTDLDSETGGESEIPPELPTETETVTDTETVPDTGTESVTEPASRTETEAASETETEAATESETETETESESETETFEIYEEIVGNVRVQLYSASALRIEQAVNGVFCDDNTIAVTNRENWDGVAVTRTVSGGVISLTTPTYTVSIPEGAEYANEVKVRDPAGESLWNTRRASTAVASLPDPAKTPRYWSFNDCPRVTVPEGGFTEVYAGAENNGFTLESNVADYYILICEDDPFRLRDDYNRLVGSCDLVTIKALGLWFSRFHAYKDTELVRLVMDYRRRNYPLDYVVVDTDWRVGSSTGYNINTTYFPDMENFLSQMHGKNVNIAFNDHVRENNNSLLSPEQLTWFNRNLTDILEMGLDTWWYDRNWHYTLKSPFADINQDMLGQMMYQSIMDAHNAPLNRRTVMLSNYYADVHSRLTLPTYIGTHRYSVQWSGDITAAVLPRELENMVQLGALTSTAYVSSDIGGHLYSPSDEMFIRWTQYGALSPIMRYHSSGDDRSPWVYGDTADRIANRYINMRYRLLPVMYNLAYENYAHGMPIARRLDFYYPEHEEAKSNDQYLLGEDILVAPIVDGDRPLEPAWLTAPDGSAGVEISFFNNPNLTGTPVHTEMAPTINFDWGVGAPARGVNADNFSAIVRATLTVGDYDLHLGTVSDDGVRVYVDERRVIDFWQASDSTVQVNKNMVLKAHTTYELRVEYYEGAGDARLRVLGIPSNLDADADKVTASRTVFIPDGKWMDVFSGTVYEGPKTATVTHGIDTSPLFVRLGSVIPLAHKSEYADTAQWERLVLDVYPADGTGDTSVLYEDDGATLDYQSGSYRKTLLSSETENGRTTVTIGAAEGDYTTAWTAREWTVRLHASDVTAVTVNGETVAFETVAADTSAAPFAAEGASPDGDVVIFTIKVPLHQESIIVIE